MSEHATEPQRIGRYRVEASIGSGAQGTVYRALDPELQRTVAVKVLRPAGVDDRSSLQAARGEARAAARLQHPAIASIFDFGLHHNRPYLVFEYVHGAGLDQVIQSRGALSEPEVWRLLKPLLAGMQHAHGEGVAHLDVKPRNIQVPADGAPRILDFGLARLFAHGPNDGRPRAGTVCYMSPEHFNDEPLGPHTDVFALCLVLMEMLTGKAAVQVRGWMEMGALLFSRGVDLSPLVANSVADAVVGVIRDGLKIDYRQRVASAGELANRLEALWEPASRADVGDDRAVQFVIRRLKRRGDLPAFPRVVLDVNRMTSENSVASVKDIANVVLRDNALSTRLLRLANSAFHTTRVKATRISDAISRLGLEQVRVAANGMSYFASMTGRKCPARLREALLVSFTSGLVARHFALSLQIAEVEEAMLCGMLYNTGEHLVIHCLPEEYDEICASLSDASDAARLSASRQVLGVDYARLGAVVASGWQLPEAIVAAIGYRSPHAAQEVAQEAAALPRIAAAANELCELAARHTPDTARAGLNEIVARHGRELAQDFDTLTAVIVSAADKMHRFAPVLGVNPDTSDYMRTLGEWVDAATESGRPQA